MCCQTNQPGPILLLRLHRGITNTSSPLAENPRTFQWILFCFSPPKIHVFDVGAQHLVYHQHPPSWCYHFLTFLQRKSRELTLPTGLFGNLISLCVPSAISHLCFESLHRQHTEKLLAGKKYRYWKFSRHLPCGFEALP